MPSMVVHVALAGLVGTALLADYFDAKAVLVVMGATAFLDFDVFVGMVFPGTHRAAFHTLLLPLLAGTLLWVDLRGRNHPWVQSLPWVGDQSRVRSRWGARGVRISGVSLFAVVFAGIGPDLFFNGANLFYPIHDRFYEVSGKFLYSNQRGFVQTFLDLDFEFVVDAIRDLEHELKSATGNGASGGVNGGESGGTSGGGGGGGASGSEGGGTGGGEAGESSGTNDGGESTVSTTENTHYQTGVDPARGDNPENVERIFPIAMTGERALLALTGYMVVALRLWMDRED